MSLYELAILGSVTDDDKAALTKTLAAMVDEFALTIGSDVQIRDAASLSERDKQAAFAGAFFGGTPQLNVTEAAELVAQKVPVIPTIGEAENFENCIPDVLKGANGLKRRRNDPELTELATALLECVGLLRRQRRVFVSYRRVESKSAAVQLHDLLTARGFDVFLDMHSIRPGDPFQDVLWHRLCDSDVMVMLDTPTYFERRWTRAEIGRARAKDVHVFRVVWPDHTPNKMTDFSETIYLEPNDLLGPEGPLQDEVAERIMMGVERLRSRSIAARYMSLTGKLRADVEKIGATVEGIGAHRAVGVRLVNDKKIWAYPVVGVPSAELLHEVADRSERAAQTGMPILVYDHVGIRDAWQSHLQWLDKNIKAVRAIRVSEAGWQLADWED